MADAKNQPPAQAPKSDLAAHKQAANKLKLARIPEKKPMTPEQMAKVRVQRIKLATQRGTTQQLATAVKLNAADLDMDPKDYAKEFNHELKLGGVTS